MGESLLPNSRNTKLVIGCVAENTPKYLSQALRLLQSLRWFGGTIADTTFLVCIVDEVDPAYQLEFERLGALVRVVSRFSPVHPQSNKLRFLELPEVTAYDTVMLMDCDTIILQDPSKYLDGEALKARIAGYPTVTFDIFKGLFSYFGLQLPMQEYRCAVSGDPTIWYCNAGVLIFTANILKTILPVWLKLTSILCDKIYLLQDARNFCEQASLTLAFFECAMPFTELPLEMNCPIPADIDTSVNNKVINCDPIIIHYHNQIDNAGLVISNSNLCAKIRIDEFNARVVQERRRRFNNRQFWDYRYAENPILGSGLGSREASLEYKKNVINKLVDTIKPFSILDIGCGDQFVTSEITDEIYLGIDLSPVVINQNQHKYPKRRYIVGDFLTEELSRFDMTICFDVVIHLDSNEMYQSFVDKVIRCTGAYGIISGYEKNPDVNSSITFYHEPLGTTLKRAGAKKICNLGTYRDTDMWLFTMIEDEQIIDGLSEV